MSRSSSRRFDLPSGRLFRSFLVFLLGLVVVGVAGCEESDESVPSSRTDLWTEGISRELADLRAGTIGDLRYHYRLSIPERTSEPVTGSVAIRFLRNDPESRPLILDFLDPGARVRSLTVGGRETPHSFLNDHVVIPADRLPDEGRVEIEIQFEAGDEALNRSDDFLYALFVPDRAHFSLPVFDQPDLKGRFRLDLDVPDSWSAISNGGLLPDSGTVRRFAETEPIPPYLFAVAAGDFEEERAARRGFDLHFLHRETDTVRVARNLETIFDLHGTALEWLEEYTGIPYPFGTFGFVAVPSFQYGGMEHPGAIYYRASSLFLEESPTQSQLLGRASVVAHETAHMWFGDLVTMEWFDDVWMKEVFANFMAAKIVHPSFPELDHDLRFYLSHVPAAYSVDRTAGSHPIRQELENLREAGTLYGPIIYQKAPIVMRQLELLVGEEELRQGLREYLESYRYGNASWTDLVAILDRRTPEDLRAWSRVWVEEAGRPTIRSELREGEDGRIESLRLEQIDPSGAERRWPQTLHVVLGYGPDSTVSIPVDLRASSMTVTEATGRPAPDFVLLGGEGRGYGLFELDPVSRAWLMERLPEVRDAIARGVGWVSLWDGVLEARIDPAAWFDLLLEGARTEDVELNLQQVLGYLQTTWWRLLDASTRERRAPEVEAVLWRGVAEAEDRTVRSAFFRAYRSVAVTPDALERLDRIWAEEEEVPGLPLSEDDYTALAVALALRGGNASRSVDEIQALQSQRIENPDRRARFEFLRPSLSPDPLVREEFFQSLEDVENRQREPWVVSALYNLHHPSREDHAERFILPSLELLEEIQRTGDIFFPDNWLSATFSGHGSPEAASTVRGFLEARPDYPDRLRRKILQSSDLLLRAAEIRRGAAAR